MLRAPSAASDAKSDGRGEGPHAASTALQNPPSSKLLFFRRYFKVFIGDSKKRSTDTHWRAKNQKAEWNYRLKFPIELPGTGRPRLSDERLTFQLWDSDLVK